jgi:hypothetical protein
VQGQKEGDAAKEFLTEMFNPLLKFMAQMQSMADNDGLLRWGKLGDWYEAKKRRIVRFSSTEEKKVRC